MSNEQLRIEDLEERYCQGRLPRRQFIAGLAAAGVTAAGIEQELGTGTARAEMRATPTAEYVCLIVLDAGRPDYITNNLAAMPLILAGNEEQKKKYLSALTEAPIFAAYACSEPDAGSDVAGMRTNVRKVGDEYVLNGQKRWITNGGYAKWYTTFARLGDPKDRHKGITCFVVSRDAPGVSVGKKEDKLGQRASNTATISFNDVEIPAENLLGEENHGFKLAMMTLDRTRPGVASMAVGIARAAFEFATEYSKERVQFGVPIAMHQAIQFMIADMATKVHAGRLLTWNAANLLDRGERNTLVSSHAKRFAADSAMEITVDAVQVYGG